MACYLAPNGVFVAVVRHSPALFKFIRHRPISGESRLFRRIAGDPWWHLVMGAFLWALAPIRYAVESFVEQFGKQSAKKRGTVASAELSPERPLKCIRIEPCWSVGRIEEVGMVRLTLRAVGSITSLALLCAHFPGFWSSTLWGQQSMQFMVQAQAEPRKGSRPAPAAPQSRVTPATPDTASPAAAIDPEIGSGQRAIVLRRC